MTITILIIWAVVGPIVGILFGRKNKAIADKLAAEAKAAKEKAEAELASIKSKVTTTS